MRTLLTASFAAAFAIVTVPALAQNAKQDFTLVNRTGYELKALFVSPSKAESWEEDILGQDVLEDGKAVNVHFNPKAETCKWDLKVIYTDDDSSAIWQSINLCEVDKITIHYDRKNDVTRATFD
jgi:hypothetical protein